MNQNYKIQIIFEGSEVRPETIQLANRIFGKTVEVLALDPSHRGDGNRSGKLAVTSFPALVVKQETEWNAASLSTSERQKIRSGRDGKGDLGIADCFRS